MLSGSFGVARAMAAWTSWAAASMLRSRENCRAMRVSPMMLLELMESRPGMAEHSFSSTVATEEAMVMGLAPGRLAPTTMVG